MKAKDPTRDKAAKEAKREEKLIQVTYKDTAVHLN